MAIPPSREATPFYKATFSLWKGWLYYIYYLFIIVFYACRYYISGSPVKEEPTKYFSLQDYTDTTTGLPSTRVSLIKELDRETIAKHTVYILAMDSGKFILTSLNGYRITAVLKVETDRTSCDTSDNDVEVLFLFVVFYGYSGFIHQ